MYRRDHIDEVKVHHALLTWQLKLHHLHGSILLRVFHEAAIGVGGFVHGQGPLPVGGFHFEEEGFHHHSLDEVVVEVVAAMISSALSFFNSIEMQMKQRCFSNPLQTITLQKGIIRRRMRHRCALSLRLKVIMSRFNGLTAYIRKENEPAHGVFEIVVAVLGGGQLGRMLC
ncbi:unnamed protein product [Lactuca saligna]|uniref:Uncharacterized protein n=1 Tax=Lactuca saligna TaxID=75948 RepID=A0AA36EFD1_LACSI|nr:unnamed protein product [Lactuca saligna]